MTKFVCISDTHNQLDRVYVPPGDVLLHTGDVSFRGTTPELMKFNQDIMKLPHKHKILVPGNHDFMFEDNPERARELIDPSVIILNGTGVEINGIKIWGSPIQPWFHDWAFNRNDQFLLEYWRQIPEDTDILMTHCPPYMIRDMVYRHGTLAIENVGDRFLADNVKNRVKPKIHVFGHIHEGHGVSEIDGISYINAAILNERYEPTNKPILFHLD